jgi:hypothetical protein
MDTHVKVVAWLRIAASAVYLVGALVVMAMFGFAGAAAGTSGDAEAARAAPWIAAFGTAIAIGLLVLALPGLITGWGLLNYRPWARIVNIVLSIIDLFGFPVGTALGVYSLWVMFQPEAVLLFEGGGPSTRYPSHF